MKTMETVHPRYPAHEVLQLQDQLSVQDGDTSECFFLSSLFFSSAIDLLGDDRCLLVAEVTVNQYTFCMHINKGCVHAYTL